ncbi:MAG: isoleucine--tRNA ligase [Alphaproteobacteria bacterium]|nr:isoleucine--tRNA ligase [Alphaproteobacteria bacterium]
MASDDTARDYRSTVFLPETPFPMKAGLPQRAPEWLARWEAMDLYARLRADARGRPRFVLHDGPPYANGDIHAGHVLNKVLKDIVIRSKQMTGFDANYVPGWDCHGLPIEWAVEQEFRKQKRNKDEVKVTDFIGECRAFASKWIDRQRAGFKRLGIVGDWDNPYLTMKPASEAAILRELHKFLMSGALYRGFKPVMWSVVEKTALAEAEVEYQDHVSTTVFVRFRVVTAGTLEGASVVIWTTTPWTLPGNRAIGYGPDLRYGLYEVGTLAEGSLARAGERLLLCDDLAESVKAAARIVSWTRLGDADPAGTVCAHPFSDLGVFYRPERGIPLLPGAFVTAEQGTGFVHLAPGHGEDDFALCKAHGIDVPQTVGPDGRYYDTVPGFGAAGGRQAARVLRPDGKEGDANGAVMEALVGAGALLARGKLEHQYPHSWRSKAPVIFRATPQWFVALDETGLREAALAAIDSTAFYPPQRRNRIRSMVQNRPDWVLSRQRVWGVPLGLFVDRRSGEILRDAAVNARIAGAIEAEGIEAWFASADGARFLAPDHQPADYEKIDDILDVWFDSACTHAFVLEARPDLKWPADIYLEGSDQHRGWFQSSLLEACGTRGRAPYDGVITHAFTLDERGRKMSKSLGNVVDPEKVIQQNGAEILRLWAATLDYSEDHRIGPEILKGTVDQYRKLRNTLRFLLGSLAGFSEAESVPYAEMPELERYVLARLAAMDERVRAGYGAYDFARVMHGLIEFMTNDLSAFYFDIRKDVLYCDGPGSLRRRAARTVLDDLLGCLTAWLAPVLVFTAEEAHLCRHGEAGDAVGSVHLRQFPDLPRDWADEDLAGRWQRIRDIRRVLTGALELQRRERVIGASLEAAPTLYLADAGDRALMGADDWADIAIVSGLTLAEGEGPADAYRLEDMPGIAVGFARAEGARCERCWKHLPDVGSHADPNLCARCHGVVEAG